LYSLFDPLFPLRPPQPGWISSLIGLRGCFPLPFSFQVCNLFALPPRLSGSQLLVLSCPEEVLSSFFPPLLSLNIFKVTLFLSFSLPPFLERTKVLTFLSLIDSTKSSSYISRPGPSHSLHPFGGDFLPFLVVGVLFFG